MFRQNVLRKRMRVQLPERLSKAMDLDDPEKLLSDIESSRDRAMIVVPMRTGMRIGESPNTRVTTFVSGRGGQNLRSCKEPSGKSRLPQ